MAQEPDVRVVDACRSADVMEADFKVAELLRASLECTGKIHKAIAEYYDFVNGMFDD